MIKTIILLIASITFIVTSADGENDTVVQNNQKQDSEQLLIKEILHRVDECRGALHDYSSKFTIEFYREDKLQSSSEYIVWINWTDNERCYLVRYLSPPNQRDNLILSKDKKMWIQTKKTTRPIPITMSQRLMGDVAVGDIIDVDLSGKYDGKILQKDTSVAIDLVANTNSALYKKIILEADARTHLPKKAEFMTASGKPLKTAYYKLDGLFEKKKVVSEIIIIDNINTTKITKINFSEYKSESLPDSYFNKNYLSKIAF
ncbi:MAG: outer membrane lipoprotein-sorting protein [Fibrobacter sp.]|mgnify:FL=1|jgi:outer membrane lipoprotein-sorting protein|nr:outer membrane lipoprotein-sorting protein [Fibrobacter sp.]